MKSTETHYIYKITNNKPTDERLYYIGVKSSLNPETDNYYGSSEYLDKAIEQIGEKHFTKDILSTWETRELANAEEVRLHWEINVVADPTYYNMINASSDKFSTLGLVPVLDTRTNTKKLVSRDEYKSNKFYQTANKGKVNVIDKRDNKTKQVSKEDFDMFDYYQSVLVGQVTVLDTRDNKKKNVSREDYHKFNYYETLMKNKITAIDKRDGSKVSISKDLFDSTDYYISSRSKKINIYNSKGILQFETWGDFKKVCEKQSLPAFALAESNRNNGKPIPLSGTQKGKTRLISSGFGNQIGWFAKEVEI